MMQQNLRATAGNYIEIGAAAYLGDLHVLDPLDGLPLGVDHEGPATPPRDDDSVLCGE